MLPDPPLIARLWHGTIHGLIGSQLTTLTSSDIQRLANDGYVVVRQAFLRADGLAMEGDGGRSWKARITCDLTTAPAGARSGAI